MFERLIERAAGAAQARVRERVRALGEAIAAEVPAGVRVEAEGERVVLSGRDLLARAAADARLRDVAGRAR